MRAIVFGGGIFGCTAAIHLAQTGHEVVIIDNAGRLMAGASAHNQFRLHMGYHYPRSAETGRECRRGMMSFAREYGQAIINGGEHYYAIASDSKVSAEQYERFCRENAMPCWRVNGGFEQVDATHVEAVYKAPESRLDVEVLQFLMERRLQRLGIMLAKVSGPISDYDLVVVAAYAGSNSVMRLIGEREEIYQYEVCEKPVLRMPEGFGAETSIVVADGPYCSLDPLGDSGLHLMGHVEHAIHSRNVGTAPVIPDYLNGLINAGCITEPEGSHWLVMREAGRRFIPALAGAQYMGSLFTVRAVLPDKDETDERPTLVTRISDRTVRIFSGKIPTAVEAARQVVAMLGEERIAA